MKGPAKSEGATQARHRDAAERRHAAPLSEEQLQQYPAALPRPTPGYANFERWQWVMQQKTQPDTENAN